MTERQWLETAIQRPRAISARMGQAIWPRLVGDGTGRLHQGGPHSGDAQPAGELPHHRDRTPCGGTGDRLNSSRGNKPSGGSGPLNRSNNVVVENSIEIVKPHRPRRLGDGQPRGEALEEGEATERKLSAFSNDSCSEPGGKEQNEPKLNLTEMTRQARDGSGWRKSEWSFIQKFYTPARVHEEEKSRRSSRLGSGGNEISRPVHRRA